MHKYQLVIALLRLCIEKHSCIGLELAADAAFFASTFIFGGQRQNEDLAHACFSYSSSSFSRTKRNDEMKRLKEHLGVPDQTKIQLATTSKITKSNDPLKVFIATGLDLGIRGNYLRWIEKWNKSGDSRKFGKVEVIDDLSQADFVLARYTLNEQARTESGSYVTPSTVWNPATNSTVTRPVARTYSYAMVPVFAYILSRTGTDFNIVYRYSDSTSLGEYRGSGESLWESFRDICLKRK